MPNRAAILKQKFQDSLALPFEYRKGEQCSKSKGQLSPNAVHANCSGVGMDLKSSIRTKFKQCGESSHRLVSCSRSRRFPEPTAKPGACPVSVETLVQANCQKPYKRRPAAVVGEHDSTTVTMSDTSAKSKLSATQQSVGVAFRWQSGGVVCVTTGVLEVAMAAFYSEWKYDSCMPLKRCRRGGFCLWHVCGFGAGAFSKCRWRVS